MRLQVDIDNERAKKLVSYAIVHGYKRDNERKAWTTKDTREAVAYGLNALLQVHM